MRALIQINIDLTLQNLQVFLKKAGFWPPLAQDENQRAPELNTIAGEIMDHVPSADKAIAEQTFRFVIRHEAKRTYGTVHHWEHRIDVRFKNEDSDALKLVCDDFVRKFYEEYSADKSFGWLGPIEVLEKNSERKAYSGEILAPGRFAIVREQKRAEWITGVTTSLAAILLLLVTLPPIADFLIPGTGQIHQWTAGVLDRIATGALVTAFISFLNVYLTYKDVKRHPSIKWGP